MVHKGINHLKEFRGQADKPKAHSIAVDGLLMSVMDMKQSTFKTEFESLSREYTRPYEASRRSKNFTKNLYHDIYPYDDNRVVFSVNDPEEPDYINASYINGYHREKRYIAAQGPSTATKADFWRMVWEERVNMIVMLNETRDTEGSDTDKYIPSIGGEEIFGHICVRGKHCQTYADYTVTTLTLTSGDDERTVTHMHFTSWPGGTVPPTPTELIEFHQKYRSLVRNDKSPTVVHCFAGVGRTGVFIALDMMVDEGLATGSVDVYHCVSELRHQRIQMVQTREQYEFLYKLTAQAMALDCWLIPKKDFAEYFNGLLEQKEEGTTMLAKQFQNCFSTMMFDEFEIAALEIDQEKRNKDRPTSEIPDPKYRPVLGGIYINAVFADRFKKKDGIVLTQMPTSVTVQDFCKLVTQVGCKIIVMLNSVDTDDKSNGIYWPEKKSSLTIEKTQVTNVKEEKYHAYIDRTLKLDFERNKTAATMEVRMIQFTAWPDADVMPEVATLVEVVELVRGELAKTPEAHLLVHCLNGSDQSGLYCVVQDLVERLHAEEEISVITSVRKLKSRRPMSVKSPKQLEFCYQAVDCYLKRSSKKENLTEL